MTRYRTISTVTLGAGVALSTATQLRPGIPLGPGEVLLVIWLAASFGAMGWSNRMEFTSAARTFACFWVSSFVLLLTGLLVAMFTGLASNEFLHDLQAYGLVAAVVIAALAKPGGADEVRGAVPVAMVVSTVGLTAVLMATFSTGSLGPVEAWIGPRFMGWSANPNQVALAMCAVPFLGLYGYAGARRRRHRAMYAAVILLGVLVGMATLSDSLVVAWTACLVLLAGWGWLRGLLRGRFPYARGAALYMVLPVAAAGIVALTATAVYRRLTASAEAIYLASGQGSLRLRLWTNGLRALEASPLVGLGPGAHSGFTGPFQDFESHNAYIDWATATGLLGLVLLAALLAWAARRTRGDSRLLAALLALALVSVFGFFMRHPTFWFYLAAITVAHRGGGVYGAAGHQGWMRHVPAGAAG